MNPQKIQNDELTNTGLDLFAIFERSVSLEFKRVITAYIIINIPHSLNYHLFLILTYRYYKIVGLF